MNYENVPLHELARSFIDAAVKFSSNREDETLDNEIAALGSAIVGRSYAGADALRSLLHHPNEQVQFNAAAWLSELDPLGAAPTLEHLDREAQDPTIGMFAQLKLMNNRQRGILPTR